MPDKKTKTSFFIISGPSGVGLDSIIEGLSAIMPIKRVITTSTRAMRPGESNGHPYYFISSEEFLRKAGKNEFFEFAEEYNHKLYGVTHDEIKRAAASGKIVIWKVEYKGVVAIKRLMPETVAILINAPIDSIENRLRERDKGASEEYFRERMEYSREWLKHRDIYDYEVVNNADMLDKAINDVAEIIKIHKK